MDRSDACMHPDGCDRCATRIEHADEHWHDWIWCDEHAVGRKTEPLADEDEERDPVNGQLVSARVGTRCE